MQEFQELIDQIINFFETKEGVRGIALTGSLGSRDSTRIDKNSDADFMFCVKEEYFDEIMKGEWIEKVSPSILIFPMVMKDEIRVLYDGFRNCDFHFYTDVQLASLEGECKIGNYIASGFKILLDSDDILENLANRVRPEKEKVDENEQEIVSGAFWHNLFFCVGLIERDDLYRVYPMTNYYLQTFLLGLFYNLDARDATKYIKRKIPQDCYEQILKCYTAFDRKQIAKGLLNCMNTYWYFQNKFAPNLSPELLERYKKIEVEATKRLQAICTNQ